MTLRLADLGVALAIVGLAWPAGAEATVAQDAGTLVPLYLQARDTHAFGNVTARALGDAVKPTAPPVPYEGVSIMLLPHSRELETQLQDVKEHFRDSLKQYMDAGAEVTDVRAAYERGLLAAGGGELIRGEVSDARGLAKLAELPAGEWLLLAWRSEPHMRNVPSTTAKSSRRDDKAMFPDVTTSTGYWVVTYWLTSVSVRAGETTEVELNDRNVWLTAVREERSVPREVPPGTTKKRR